MPLPPELDSMTEVLPESGKTRKKGLIRRMYDWVLSWADSRWGTPALFVISFLESSVFPIPPDVLQIALSVSRPRRAFLYAAISTVASVLGALFGYAIGYALWQTVGGFFQQYVPGFSPENIEMVGRKFQENAFLFILGAAFTPIPFKLITIASGIFSGFVPLGTLVIASILGRSARFFLVASLIFFFGPQVRSFVEKRLEWITIALFVAVVAGFFAIKYLGH